MKKLGFGMMRLPKKGEKIDREKTKEMVDLFIKKGFTYFDTAYGYHDKESELAIKECLTGRYPRDAYILTDKLTINYVKGPEELINFFNNQLERTGVDYFDNYLHHSLDRDNYKIHKEYGAFEKLKKLK